MTLLDQEIERFINDPARIEIIRAMMMAAESIHNRWRLYGDVYLTAQAHDALYDGDCESSVITVLTATFDHNGETMPNAGPFIFCEYAVNDVGGELVIGGFARVDFFSARSRLQGIFTPHAVWSDISYFMLGDDERADLFLKLLSARP